MEYVGQIFRETESQVADLEAVDDGTSTLVTISRNGETVIQFPMPAGADSNEIELRAGNVINQTGLSPTNVRVDVQPV